MKKLFVILSAFSLLTLTACGFSEEVKEPDNNLPDGIGQMVQLDSPTENSTISSPVNISGEAKGSMYFEAVFPIEIQDANNVVIGSGQAQAQADWMDSGFVPFTAQITFTAPTTTTGFIVFKKDNPSGEPANDFSVSFPVNF